MIKQKRRPLPLIPSGRRYDKADGVRFITFRDAWHIVGLASEMIPGKPVWVNRFDGPTEQVLVEEYVAERTVRHAGVPHRYVIAAFSNIRSEGEPGRRAPDRRKGYGSPRDRR